MVVVVVALVVVALVVVYVGLVDVKGEWRGRSKLALPPLARNSWRSRRTRAANSAVDRGSSTGGFSSTGEGEGGVTVVP